MSTSPSVILFQGDSITDGEDHAMMIRIIFSDTDMRI